MLTRRPPSSIPFHFIIRSLDRTQSYRSLRDGKAFDNETILSVASKHGVSAAQVMGRWLIQKGIVYIPKSVRKDRMQENAKVFHFALDEDDVALLDSLTTPSALDTYEALYRKCVVRDTPITEGIKKDITKD